MDYAKIKLNYLQHEWLNFTDHEARYWIADLNAKIEWRNQERIARNSPLVPYLDIVQCAEWRDRFTQTRLAFIEAKKRPWHECVAWVWGRVQQGEGAIVKDGIVRRAENPLFLGYTLRIWDDRPDEAIDMERMIALHTGHMYRTWRRGGIIFRVSKMGERQHKEAEAEAVEAFSERYFASRNGYTIMDGYAHYDFDPEHPRVTRTSLLVPDGTVGKRGSRL